MQIRFLQRVVCDGTHYRPDDTCDSADLAAGTLASLLYSQRCAIVESPSATRNVAVSPADQPLLTTPAADGRGVTAEDAGLETDHEPLLLLAIPGFPSRALPHLAAEKITTVEGITDWIAENGKLEQITGIGRATAAEISAAIAAVDDTQTKGT